MPLGQYPDFAACVAAQQAKGTSEESARKICGAIQARVESVRVDFVAPIHCDPTRDDGVLATPDPETGFLKLDGRLTRAGVFTYRDASGAEWGEYRADAEVFAPASLDSFRGVVLTNDHPEDFVTRKNVKTVQAGHVGTDVRRDGDFVRASMVVTDAETILAIQEGKRQLSCGYTAVMVRESGIVDGTPYEARQTEIRGNHVAVVDIGRAGPICALLSRGDGAAYTEHTMTVKHTSETAMKKLAAAQNKFDIKLDEGTKVTPVMLGQIGAILGLGEDASVSDILAVLAEVVDPAAAAPPPPEEPAPPDGETMGMPGPFDDATKLRAKVDILESAQQTAAQTFSQRVDQRVALLESVRKICPNVATTDVSYESLMRAVVLEVSPNLAAKLDNNTKMPGYLRAAYDAALELHASRQTHVDELTGVLFDAHTQDEDKDPDKAYADYMKRATNGRARKEV